MSEYVVTIRTDLKADRIEALLEPYADVVSIGLNEQTFAVNLIVNGELIDSVDVNDFDESAACIQALGGFRSGEDYDVIKASDITLDMIQLERI